MTKKSLGFIFILFIITSCIPEDKTDVFWNSITTTNKHQPFVFIFSNTQMPTCAKHGLPQLKQVLNGEIDSINSEDVNSCMMYPSVIDPQYSSTAEELKFLFDQNGNNTFNTWPAYVNNLTCFNNDSNLWYESIKNSQNKISAVNLGIKSTPSNQEIKLYVKGVYTSSVADHSVAVYAYRKEELVSQKTDSGSEILTVKNKLIYALTPTAGKSLPSNSSGQEFREIFTLNTSGENLSSLGLVAVIYSLKNNVPHEVINSIKLEEL
tara:strand:- start:1023 stop:1817 length:795 start_codon:yes stop_codon:yes gene_type:complete